MKKRGILLIAALLLLTFILVRFVEDPEDRTDRVFRQNQAAFEETAAALTGGGWKAPYGVRYLNVWPCQGREDAEQVEFDMGGWGIGSQTDYWGVYATTDGQPIGFQGTDLSLTADGDGFTWREEDGDDAYYTREIIPGWWYYRMHF